MCAAQAEDLSSVANHHAPPEWPGGAGCLDGGAGCLDGGAGCLDGGASCLDGGAGCLKATWSYTSGVLNICSIRYANFMGSLGGLTLSVALAGLWVGLGQLLGFSNPNWWLIIGTYTGLVSYVHSYFS